MNINEHVYSCTQNADAEMIKKCRSTKVEEILKLYEVK